MDTTFSVLPPAPDYNPVKQAIARAEELGEKSIATTLGYFSTMPSSTDIIANPVLYHTPVDCNGTKITLDIRSFTIRGVINEPDILRGKAGPVDVIFTGLFGDSGGSAAAKETLAKFINDKFFESVKGNGRLVEMVASFVSKYPGWGPEVAMQHMATLRKARAGRPEVGGIHDERDSGELLRDMIACHMDNVAVGGVSAYMNYLVATKPQVTESDLAAQTNEFISSEVARGRNAFQVSYSLILGRHANDHESLILERMGTIQIHHGSAGSNMVARYMATLHTMSVSDFFTAS
ncbi:MAG TPA: hypothetical protein VGW58_03130, partial [Pyrinomonadaceae bacterium]|nr:hypothetical protein [Pyrinomonadaceae bacterium]